MTAFRILSCCILLVIFTDGKPSELRQSDCGRTGGSCISTRLTCDGYFDQTMSGCKRSQLCCMKLSHTIDEEPVNQPQQDLVHPGTDQCGLITVLNPVTPDPRLRIVGGQMAVDGEWPWQVGFHDDYRGHFCGGTLISEQWILTAAHCLVRYTPQEVTVVLGEHHLEDVTGKEQKIAVSNWIIHPQFSPSDNNLPNDIALVKLDTQVNISGNYIRKACLPQVTDVFDASDDCSISGWGSTMGTGDNTYLQHMKIQITSREACNETWRGAVNDNHICIGNGDIGACQGDSGGPLVCVRNGYYHLVGVTSWGTLSCTVYGYPNVYTRVMSYIEWINANIHN